MIRKYKALDLDPVMKIWLSTNIQTHSFISERYWADNYAVVKEMLPRAEIYVYVDDRSDQIEGFIGVTGHYIAGIFVRGEAQSKGIGKQLLDHVKISKPRLDLKVYQKNERAVRFYQREHFLIHSENIDEDTNENELMMMWER